MATNTTSPFGIQQPALPSDPFANMGTNNGQPATWNDYVTAASNQITPGTQNLTNAMQQQAQTQKANYNTMAQQQLAQISTVQTQYSDLAKEFQTQENSAMTAQQSANAYSNQVAQERVGAAQTSLAAEGVTNAQGSFAAPVTSAQNAAVQTAQQNAIKINQIAEQYGAKQQTITDTLNANVQQLQQKAADYQMQGNQAMSDMLVNVAQLKYQQNQQITSLAESFMASSIKAQQDVWLDYSKMVTAEHEQEQLDLMSNHYAAMETYENNRIAVEKDRLLVSQENANTKVTQNSSGGESFIYKNQPVSAAYYAQKTGTPLTQLLGQSQDPNDMAFLNDYNASLQTIYDQKSQSLRDDAIKQQNEKLQQMYPNIMGNVKLF